MTKFKLSDFQNTNDVLVRKSQINDEYSTIVDKVTEEKRDIKPEEQERLDEILEQRKQLDDIFRILSQKEEGVKQEARKAQPRYSHEEKENRELSKFSFLKVVQSHFSSRDGGKPLDGLELEMHQEAAIEHERASVGRKLEGVGIPSIIFRAMTATGETSVAGDQGGNWVPTLKQGLMMALRPRLVMSGLGAQFITGLSGNVDFPKGGAVTGGWKGEIIDSDDGTPGTDVISMNPNRLPTTVKYSKQLMLQSAPDVENFLINDIFRFIAQQVDAGAINGRGTATYHEPLGILQTNDIGGVPIDTNGGAPTWAHISKLEEAVAIRDGDVGALAYLTNPKVRQKLKTTLKATGYPGFVWENGNEPLNGYRAGVTNLVPSNLTKAGGSSLSAIIFGNFNDLVIGNWGGMDIVVDPYTAKIKGMVEITANTYWDAKVLRKESFAAVVDAATV